MQMSFWIRDKTEEEVGVSLPILESEDEVSAHSEASSKFELASLCPCLANISRGFAMSSLKKQMSLIGAQNGARIFHRASILDKVDIPATSR